VGQGGIRWVSGGDNDDGDNNRMLAFANGLPKHVRPNAAGSLSLTLQHFSQVGIILLLRERGGMVSGQRKEAKKKKRRKKKEKGTSESLFWCRVEGEVSPGGTIPGVVITLGLGFCFKFSAAAI